LYDTAPASDQEQLVAAIGPDGTTEKFELRLNSDGTITAYDSTGAAKGTSAALNSQTWYCIEFVARNGTSADYDWRIDGETVSDGTANFGATNPQYIHLGKSADLNGQSVDFYYDNYVLNLNDFVGPCHIDQVYCDKDGTTHDWHDGTGTDYQEVDETGIDTADYLRGTSQTHQVGFSDPSIAQDIFCVGAEYYIKYNESGASVACLFSSNGTTDNRSTLAATSGWVWRCQYVGLNPDDGEPFDSADIANVEIGVQETAGFAADCAILGLLVLVEDIEPGSSPSSSPSESPSE